MDEQEVCDHCAGEHLGSCSVDNTLIALSTNLRNSFQGLSRWSISDTTAGLFKVYNLHALHGATDTIINGVEINDRNELEEMLEWMRWSHAAYENNKQNLANKLKLNDKDLVKMIAISFVNKPAFFIGIHHVRKCVVMSIRGTYQKQDVFTDLNPHSEQFQEGSAHSGMLGAARWLFANESQTLQNLLAKYLGYKLILTGHSLGAAIAGLLAMMIRATDGWFMPKEFSGVPSSRVLCWGFGCGPCVDRKLAESTNFICNVVLQDDIVARITPAAIEALRNEILATSWSQVVQDETTKKLLDTLGHVHSNFGSMLSTGGSILSSMGAQAGAVLFQNIDSLRTYASSSSRSSFVDHPLEKIDISTRKDDTGVPDTEIVAEAVLNNGTTKEDAEQPDSGVAAAQSNMNIPTTKDDAEESESGIAAQTVMALATGSSITMEELERRRLFVPGILYHIKRLQHREGRMSLPTSPGKVVQAGGEALKRLESKYVVVRGMDPKERFGRIVVSRTMISDHKCPRYIRGISVALSSCSNP